MMKVVLFVLAFAAVALAIDAVGEGNSGAPAQVVNPANWHGTWTAKNRYGGVMYACPRGNRLYGVYSNAGFFIGKIEGREVEGTWYEGGRGDRNDWQGSFRITISDDNQSFDGFWYRVTQDGTEIKWHEHRLGAPYPSEPSSIDCLVPYQENVLGSFYSNPGEGREPVVTHLCKDRWDQFTDLSTPQTVTLRDGVLTMLLDSTDTDTIVMVALVLTFCVPSLKPKFADSTGEVALLLKTSPLPKKRFSPALPSPPNSVNVRRLAQVS